MIISLTPIRGVAVIDLDLRSDDRGFFARTFCVAEFAEAGLGTAVEQSNLSFNHRAGTVRGMHYQVAPHPEAKLVRCTAGAVVDTIIDMRPGSATRLQNVKVERSAANRRALYVPPYFAHGYQWHHRRGRRSRDAAVPGAAGEGQHLRPLRRPLPRLLSRRGPRPRRPGQENPREAEWRLFGEKYDSLGTLLKRAREEATDNPVISYLTLLCAKQLVERVASKNRAWWRAHEEQVRRLQQHLDGIADVRSQLVAASPDLKEFLDWLEPEFLAFRGTVRR